MTGPEIISSAVTLPLIIGLGLSLMVLERLFPDQPLPPVKGWWGRVAFINFLQLAVVILGGLTWDHWFHTYSVLSLRDFAGVPAQVALAYFVITFIYYWWHRVRHDSNFLWLTCHQLHHSPSRIETITSFYKHPVELILNGILICMINYALLGITIEAGAWVTFVTAAAEFFYHMNIKTPRWVGFFIQRPEMHRIHHQRSRHYDNFSDLPLWDMLFGTYNNPATYTGECGFTPEREAAFSKLLLFTNVNNPYVKKENPVQKDNS